MIGVESKMPMADSLRLISSRREQPEAGLRLAE